jgi:hypothetical protein
MVMRPSQKSPSRGAAILDITAPPFFKPRGRKRCAYEAASFSALCMRLTTVRGSYCGVISAEVSRVTTVT